MGVQFTGSLDVLGGILMDDGGIKFTSSLTTTLIYVSPPLNSSGAIGDIKGMISFASGVPGFWYYCYRDYIGVGTQVWQRIAVDATAW